MRLLRYRPRKPSEQDPRIDTVEQIPAAMLQAEEAHEAVKDYEKERLSILAIRNALGADAKPQHLEMLDEIAAQLSENAEEARAAEVSWNEIADILRSKSVR